jgi:hypothetical protein
MSKLNDIKDHELGFYTGTKDLYDLDALDLPVEIAGLNVWNSMEQSHQNRVLGGLLRNLALRTFENVPLYRETVWANNDEVGFKRNIKDIESIKDIVNLPVLSKDSLPGTGSNSSSGVHGFRSLAIENPNILVPFNFREVISRQEHANSNHQLILEKYRGEGVLDFGSGGSMGTSTKTRLSYLTVEMEAYALSRALTMNGLKEGQKIACLYNNTHKGGLQLERAADIMGMDFHSRDKIMNWIKDEGYDLNDDAQIRNGIRQYVQKNKIDIMEAVQPPLSFIKKNVKGGGLAFMTMYEEDPSAFSSVSHAFLTGFPVPSEAYELLRKDGINVSTTWGASEAMALGTYANENYSCRRSNVNDLVATPFPTVGLVGKLNRETLPEKLVEVSSGDDGLLLISSLIGGGSTYINYLIGDLCFKTGNGYENINRAKMDLSTIQGSCGSDAL